jgi:hypothetical protein
MEEDARKFKTEREKTLVKGDKRKTTRNGERENKQKEERKKE